MARNSPQGSRGYRSCGFAGLSRRCLGSGRGDIPSSGTVLVAVMASTGVAAWFADRSSQNGRAMAIGAGIAFFVLALFSNVVFTVVFLTAAVLVIVGLSMVRPT